MATNYNPTSSSQQDMTETLHFSGLPVGQKLTPECEVIKEGENATPEERFEDCEKNPDHKNSIPVNKFDIKDLPKKLQTEKMVRSIKNRSNCTVRVVVRYVSKNRPDTFSDNRVSYPYSKLKDQRTKMYGTGFVFLPDNIYKVSQRCPCPLCQRASHPKNEFWVVLVNTATHVIYDDSEAETSTFDCFFDTDDRIGVKKLYGIRRHKIGKIPHSHYKSDVVTVVSVTHEIETVVKLKQCKYTILDVLDTLDCHSPPTPGVIVSHPHGCSKRISFGNILSVKCFGADHDNSNKPYEFYGDVICRVPMSLHEDHRKLLKRIIRFYPKSSMEKRRWILYALPYMGMTLNDTNPEKDVYTIIIGAACAFYKKAIVFDIIADLQLDIRSLDQAISALIRNRLCNKKTPELFDVGLILWKCYFILIWHLFNFDNCLSGKNQSRVTDGMIFKLFLDIIYGWMPKLLPIFDLQQYYSEKAKEYSILDHIFSDSMDVKRTVVNILFGFESVADCFNKDIVDHKLIERILNLCNLIGVLNDYIKKRRHFFEEILVDPESDDFLQPGSEFLLPMDTIVTLPQNSNYMCEYKNCNPGYYVFPPGTRFHWFHESHVLPLPDDVEFTYIEYYPSYRFSMIYDTPTCPGTSGADLYVDIPDFRYNKIQVHTGSVNEQLSSSGITSFYHDNALQKDFLDCIVNI